MKAALRLVLFTTVALVLATAAFAQGTTSSLNGTVTHEGAPLPGVTITISSPAMQGTRTTVSAANGDYNFPALPPGDFTLTFEMVGMASVRRTVHLGLAKAEHVGAAMQLAAVAETTTVTAAAPAALEATEVQANYTAKLVDSLPVGRTIYDVKQLAPGVNGYTVSGAFVYDTLHLTDGAVPNDFGGASLFIEDAIQETTIMTGAISAEYGRFTGGVVSTITRSGGNDFSGSFRDSFTNAAWDRTTPAGEANEKSVVDKSYEATLGGRIVRDRLWFFSGARYAKKNYPWFYANSNVPMPTSVYRDRRYEVKLTGQISPKHSLVGSYLGFEEDARPTCPYGCWELSAMDLDGVRVPQSMAAARYNGVPTGNLLLEAGWSARKTATRDLGGESRDRVFGTAAWDILDTGAGWGAPFGCGVCGPRLNDNEYRVLKSSYYLATPAAGTHNIVAGYENFAESRFANNYQSGSNFAIYVFSTPPEFDADGSFRPIVSAGDSLVYFPILLLSSGSNFVTESLFVNDKWDLGSKWSFNLGVRYDHNDGTDSAGHPISNDSNISPRLGVIHDIKGDGRFRVNASYSRYVSKILEYFGGAAGGGNPSYIYYEYDGPQIGGAGTGLGSFDVIARLFDWFDSVGGLQNTDHLVAASVPGINLRFDGTLVSPNAEELTVGFGAQLGAKGLVRFDYIDRSWRDFYSIGTQPNDQVENPIVAGEFLDVQTYTNSSDVERTYHALQIQAGYRLSDRLDLGGNYTWSELKGNGFGGVYPSPNTADSYREYKAFPQNNPVGLLPEDQTHKARLWASYDHSLGLLGNLNASVLERYDSGAPYDAAQNVRVNLFVTNPGYATPPSSAMYFFSDRGAYRWDATTATDIALNWELPLSKVRLFVQGELLNAFNESAQVGGGTGVTVRADRDPTTPGIQRFNPFTMQPVECVAGGPAVCDWTKSASFGKPTGPSSYQTPLTYRFSAGIRF